MIAEFLRTELAPSRARWRATGRIVVACVAATAAIMILHMPNGYWVVITILVMSQPNAGASLVRGFQRLIASVAGAAVAIAIIVVFAQQPWFELAALGGICGFGLFLSRTSTAPYVGLLAAMTPAILIGLAGVDPEVGVTDGLWRGAAVALGVIIGSAAQLWVWPEDPEDLLLDDLAATLASIEQALARLAGGGTAPSVGDRSARLREGAFQGLGRQLDWLANAEALHLGLKQRHGEQLVLIGSVHRLATATLALADRLATATAGPALDTPARAHLAESVARCARLRAALERRPVPATPSLPSAPPLPVARAGLLELEHALDQMEAASGLLGIPAASGARDEVPPSPLDQGTGPFFLAPGFSLANGPAVRFALKGGLVAMLSFATVEALHWPGIGTAVVTSVIVAQSSFGAMVQKAALRLVGALVGGALGIATIVFAIPVMENLSSLLVMTAIAMGIAGYVLAGSARISYAGIQIGLAWVLTLLVALGPSANLVAPRDRVIGIVVGIVFGLAVFRLLWPELASVGMRSSVVASLRHLAGLSRVALPGEPGAALTRPGGGFRWQITKDFIDALRLAAESRLEPQSRSDTDRAAQEATLRVLNSAQSTFLAVLAVVRHRLNAGLLPWPAATQAALLALGTAVGPFLEAVADRVESGRDAPAPDVEALLASARRLVSSRETQTDPELPNFVTRVALYETLVTHLTRLEVRSRELIHHTPS